MMKLIKNHWYEFIDRGERHVGCYVGKQASFGCCVCGRGNNAYTFNIYYSNAKFNIGCETWGYGKEHLPKLLEDFGLRNEVIIDTFID